MNNREACHDARVRKLWWHNLICSHLHQNIELKYCNPRSKFMISSIELDSLSVSVHESTSDCTTVHNLEHKEDVPSHSISANTQFQWNCHHGDQLSLRLQVFQIRPGSIVQLHTFWPPLYNGGKAEIGCPGSAQASSAGKKVGCFPWLPLHNRNNSEVLEKN